VYGSAFFLVAAYSPLAIRERELASDIARSRHSANWEEHLPKARELIQKDEAEENKLGQRVRDTFPLADVFVASHRPVELREQVDRFVEIIFDHPFHTPTRGEFAMFQAFSTMLRSSDLARQVGAVISTVGGDVVAVGTNEVPRAGGGSYWEGDSDDARDFALGRSTSKEWRSLALGEVLRRLNEGGRLVLSAGESPDSVLAEILKAMDGTLLMNSGEFGRTVHAEMSALLDAARRGVRVEGCTLYTTTFPCHNCARHIVAAGISRVEYIEPFPKSLAEDLHGDAIRVEGESDQPRRVAFLPFVGIAPSRYADLFRMTKRRDSTGTVRRWNQADALPRYPDTWPAVTYPLAEDKVILDLRTGMVQAGLLNESENSSGTHEEESDARG
jgi:cytidine deaminase